jgi:hypothetical protein
VSQLRPRRIVRFVVAFASIALVVPMGVATAGSPAAPSAAAAHLGAAVDGVTRVGAPVAPTKFIGDLRSLPQIPARPRPDIELIGPNAVAAGPSEESPGPAGPAGPSAPMPAATRSFPGLSFNDTCSGGSCGSGWPPDTNGDVGPNHYIQAVNTSYAIYSKTGTLLTSFSEDALFSVTGSNPCNGNSAGDPVVLYDTIADRWILTNFAFGVDGSGNPVSPFYECIAASASSDPVSGGWNLYTLRMDPGTAGWPAVGTMNDYPRFGLWTDCLYYTANEFTFPSGTFAGTTFASLSRSDMYAGLTLTWALGYLTTTNDPFTLIPSNLRAPGAASRPPAGTPNYVVSESYTTAAFEVRKLTPGANCGGGGTLTAATMVTHPATGLAPDVPQPATSTKLDALPKRLMQQVQYRKVGSAESLWVVNTVATPSASTASPQWAEINVTGGTITTTPAQRQVYAPDTTLSRWMGSIAADKDGNVALGYSTSNGTAPNYPSIAYSGRLAGDPLNTLPRTEVQLIAGAGSQTGTDRWGDYSAMSVDPVDDCTFWYTTQYYSSQANGTSGNWQTRIGAFKFPTCGPSATPTVTSVSPTSGPPSGGTPVTITGTALTGATAVAFGATAAASFSVDSDTSITATSPAGSGTVHVTVMTPGGTSVTSSADQFTYVAQVGTLRVTSSPALPTQISIDGTIADSWGLNWVEVAPGSHVVSFSHIEGWTEPAPQTVTVTAGATTTVVGTFAQRGTLRVMTSPAVAATISVDGSPRNAWGMWTDLPIGSHQVCFGPVAGYTAPACQDVTLTAGSQTTVTGTYTPS